MSIEVTEEFEGLNAVVTGGTKGIGRATVDRLRAGGAQVLTSARNGEDGEDFVAADVSTPEGVERLARKARERLGKIDILVHVVGSSTAPAGGFAMLDDGEWESALGPNLLAAVRLDRALVPDMVKQGSGDAAPRRNFGLRRGKGRTEHLQQGPLQ